MNFSPLVLLGYIDPFSGAIVVQVIIAGIVSVAAFFRRSLYALAKPLLFWKSSEASSDDEVAPPLDPPPLEQRSDPADGQE